jgi:protein required for attachment to host cells
MNTIWVLVTNQAEAQIYSTERLPGNLVLVTILTHAEGRAHARDLTSDGPGRLHYRHGSGRHSMEPATGVKEVERHKFVKQITTLLEAAHARGDYQQLVLLAAPAVLGVLRKGLTRAIASTVIKEIDKDVVGQSVEKIEAQLS